MIAATVPTITLILYATGTLERLRAMVRRFVPRPGEAASPSLADQPRDRALTDVLLFLAFCAPLAVFFLPKTPIFGGTKHWMTAYPFLCLLAGRGFVFAAARLAELLPPERAWQRASHRMLLPALASVVLIGPLCMTLHSVPWGLSFYAPLVGGTPGAANLGLNRTFWGYTTGALQGFINQRAPEHASVYVHDTALQSWEMLRVDGRLRSDLRGTLSITGSTLALYHHEPHMRRVEYEIWVDYGHAAPAAIGAFDGVPIVWVYAR